MTRKKSMEEFFCLLKRNKYGQLNQIKKNQNREKEKKISARSSSSSSSFSRSHLRTLLSNLLVGFSNSLLFAKRFLSHAINQSQTEQYQEKEREEMSCMKQTRQDSSRKREKFLSPCTMSQPLTHHHREENYRQRK